MDVSSVVFKDNDTPVAVFLGEMPDFLTTDANTAEAYRRLERTRYLQDAKEIDAALRFYNFLLS